MNNINISILQDILILLGITISNLITNSFVIEERQNYKKLFTTMIGLILIIYMSVKLSIDVFKVFPIGGM